MVMSVTEALTVSALVAILHSLTIYGGLMNPLSAHAASLSIRKDSIPTTNASFSIANISQTSNIELSTNGVHLSCRGNMLGFNLDVESCRSALRSIDVTEQSSISWGPRTIPRIYDVPIPHRWVAGECGQTERSRVCC